MQQSCIKRDTSGGAPKGGGVPPVLIHSCWSSIETIQLLGYTLHYTTLHYSPLHYTTLHYITLQSITCDLSIYLSIYIYICINNNPIHKRYIKVLLLALLSKCWIAPSLSLQELHFWIDRASGSTLAGSRSRALRAAPQVAMIYLSVCMYVYIYIHSYS